MIPPSVSGSNGPEQIVQVWMLTDLSPLPEWLVLDERRCAGQPHCLSCYFCPTDRVSHQPLDELRVQLPTSRRPFRVRQFDGVGQHELHFSVQAPRRILVRRGGWPAIR